MDQYVEGNYYEYLRDRRTKYLVLRFIKRENGNNLFYDLNNKKEVKVFVDEIFWELSIYMCRRLELKFNQKKKLIFEDFFDYIKLTYNKDLQLEDNSEDHKYKIKGIFILDGGYYEIDPFEISNNINDFFKKLDEKLQIKLTIKEKDDFISKQFAK